jgi:hypothetical protein
MTIKRPTQDQLAEIADFGFAMTPAEIAAYAEVRISDEQQWL